MVNRNGHFYISIGKSIARIFGCLFAIWKNATPDGLIMMAVFFFFAEIGGMLEEFFDKR